MNRDVNGDGENVMIPYFAHEAETARMERQARRLWIVILVLIACLVLTNGAWIVYENQFQDVTVTQEAETEDGGNNYLNATGEMTVNGEGETDNPDSR